MAQRGVNKVILIGHIGSAPKNASTPNGSAVCNFSVATSETWKDKQTGAAQERTEWHRVVIFGKLAEIAGSYLKSGSKVYVEGKLRTRKWDDNGTERWMTEVVADEFQTLDKREHGGDAGAVQGGNRQQPSHPEPEMFDDDIPF